MSAIKEIRYVQGKLLGHVKVFSFRICKAVLCAVLAGTFAVHLLYKKQLLTWVG